MTTDDCIFSRGPEPHQHRQECLCHIDPAVLAQLPPQARVSVAQTLLSVPWQDAVPGIANPVTVFRRKRDYFAASQDEAAPVVLRRIRLIAAAAWIAFAVPVLMTGGWRGLLGLTCSGLVTMINFLWLEKIVDALLQPTPARHPWRLTVRTLSRFALLGVALSVTIFVARINAVSVLLGFSIVVAGIMGEAVYSTIRSFAD
jgi:hypothetical protein